MSLAPLLVRSTRIFAGFPPVIVQAYVRKVICSASNTRIVAQSLRNKNRRLHLSKNIKFLLLLNGTSIVLVFYTARSQSVNCLWSCFSFKLFCRHCWNKATPDNGWKKPCEAGLWQLLLSCKLCCFFLFCFFLGDFENLPSLSVHLCSGLKALICSQNKKNSREFYLQWPNYALARIVNEANVTKEKNY